MKEKWSFCCKAVFPGTVSQTAVKQKHLVVIRACISAGPLPGNTASGLGAVCVFFCHAKRRPYLSLFMSHFLLPCWAFIVPSTRHRRFNIFNFREPITVFPEMEEDEEIRTIPQAKWRLSVHSKAAVHSLVILPLLPFLTSCSSAPCCSSFYFISISFAGNLLLVCYLEGCRFLGYC